MPVKPQHGLKNLLVDRLIGAVGAVARIAPHGAVGAAATGLGALAARVDARHRRLIERQMRLAFRGEKSEAEIARLARECYRHEALVFLELMRLSKITPENWREFAEVTDEIKARALKTSGRGVLVITGHIGSWEVLSHIAGLAGYPITALARPMKNAYLDERLTRLRTLTGNQFLTKYNSLREIGRRLEGGEWVCFLYDQNGQPNDAFIPFFGIPAATWRSAPFLHMKYNAPILVLTLARADRVGRRYNLRVQRVLEPVENETREQCEQRVLTEINNAFEEAIREYPEQWLWQHKRWKTRPPGENSKLIDGVPAFDEDATR